MAVFYLDASALVKRYRTEQGTAVVDVLLDRRRSEDRFYTSLLSLLEVTSAIHRRLAARYLDELLAQAILARFRGELFDSVCTSPLDDDTLSSAVTVVERHKLRSGDAIHLATALALAAAAPNAQVVVVTSDRELVRSSVGSGLAVLNPTEVDAMAQLREFRHG